MASTARSAVRRGSRRFRSVVIATLVGLAAYLLFVDTPAGPRDIRQFQPDRLADLELDMWQAYYAKENVRLFKDLVVSLREQYRYTWSMSVRAAFHLARAAARFGNLRADYDSVLPDLEKAFTIARDWTHARYDPAALARAELAWWVARRDPALNSPENVGRLIAETYAVMYGTPVERVSEAALLRARAARIRDEGGQQADWPTIGRMLRTSYRTLSESLIPHP
jgi:hypothetical protein